MRLTRRELRSIIIETILGEKALSEGYDSMSDALRGWTNDKVASLVEESGISFS